MYIDNKWYGHSFILSKYLNIKEKIIFGSLQHGWLLSDDSIYKIFYKKKIMKAGSRSFNFAPWLCWSKEMNALCRRNNIKNTHAIGSPFLYLCKIKKKKIIKTNGTLVFLPRSTNESFVQVDYKKIVKILNKNKFPKPYTYCTGKSDLDYINSKKKNYDKNSKFVSCGDRHDKYFLFKLYDFLLSHKKIVTFQITSGMLYSMFLKKKTFIFFNNVIKKVSYPNFVKQKKNKEKYNFKTYSLKQILMNEKIKFKQLQISGLDINNNELIETQRNAILKILGYDCIKSKKALLKILGWNNSLKIFFANFLHVLIRIKYNLI